jgi:hypothetical protein
MIHVDIRMFYKHENYTVSSLKDSQSVTSWCSILKENPNYYT